VVNVSFIFPAEIDGGGTSKNFILANLCSQLYQGNGCDAIPLQADRLER
jgi:hypothetical protein